MSKKEIACFGAWCAQLYLVLFLPQVADEAYYQRWGEQLSLGYFDHPPGVALWSMMGGRWLNLFLQPLAWLLFWFAARRLGSQVPLSLFILVVWCTPLGLASGVLVTPDAPLLLSWSIAVFGYAYRSILLTAFGLTLGLWSKAMMIPAGLGLLWLWWSDSRCSKSQRRVNVGSILLITTLFYSPHLYWSLVNGGLPWSFQGGRSLKFFSTPEMLAGQLWVGGGLWTVYLLKRYWSTFQSLWRRQVVGIDQVISERERCWFWLSAPSFIVWFISSLSTRVEPNWTALAWPIGLIWVLETVSRHVCRKALIVSFCMTAPCLLLPLVHQVIPLGWGPPRDGNRLLECVHQATQKYTISAWVVGRYQEAALLSLPLSASDAFVPKGFNHRLHASLFYKRAAKRRRSQYDLSSTATMPSLHCDAIWLGPKEWIGDRCRSETLPISDDDHRCRLNLSRCICDLNN